MQLAEQQWAEAWAAALAKATHLTRGDVHRAQDLAAQVMEKLLTHQGELRDNLVGFVRVMTQNTYLDERSRQQAAFRRGGTIKHPMDESIFGVEGVIKASLVEESPSAQLIREERHRKQVAVCRQILEALPERQRLLLTMAALDLPRARIAEELGYASAQVVTQTLRRLYTRIRAEIGLGPEDVLYSPLRS